jgi:hypothetical protein
MIDRPTRLGDTIDDYCSRCKLVLDHAVQSLQGETIQTVVCNTCMHSHAYRHGKAGRKKSSKKSLFDQILEKRPPTRVATIPTTKKPSAGEEDD